MIRACKRCKDGIDAVDTDGRPYVICALIPPSALGVQRIEKVTIDGVAQPPDLKTDVKWVRPPMVPDGFCGQFKLSVGKLFARNEPRA
jgi:hypothetical protein